MNSKTGTAKTTKRKEETESAHPNFTSLDSFYLRCAFLDSSPSKRIGPYREIRNLNEVLGHISSSRNNSAVKKYGDFPELSRTKFSSIQGYLRDCYILAKIRNGYGIDEFKQNNKTGEEKLEALDKLYLTAERFVKNFFSDKESAKKGNIALYNAVQRKLLFSLPFSAQELNLNKHGEKKEFIKLLRDTLAVKLNYVLKFQQAEDAKVSSITSLMDMTQEHKCKKFFLNFILAERENLKRYAESKYRDSISSIYACSCVVPDMNEVTPFIGEIEKYGRSLGLTEDAEIEKFLKSAAGMSCKKGIKELEKLLECLDAVQDFCKNELDITEGTEIARVVRSITCMQHNKGPLSYKDTYTFLSNAKDVCCSELGSNLPDDKKFVTAIIRSFTGMQSGKGPLSKDAMKNILQGISEACQEELGTNNPTEIKEILKSITGIQDGTRTLSKKEIAKIIKDTKDACKKVLGTTDIQIVKSILKSFSSMQCGLGPLTKNEITAFLTGAKEACIETLGITDIIDITRIISSLSGMQHGLGPLTKNEMITFLTGAKEACIKILGITDVNDITRVIMSLTSMQNGLGPLTKNEITAFLTDVKEACIEILGITDVSNITRVIMSLTSVQCGLGRLTKNEIKNFFNIIVSSSPKGDIKKAIRFVTSKYNKKGIPSDEVLKETLKAVSK